MRQPDPRLAVLLAIGLSVASVGCGCERAPAAAGDATRSGTPEPTSAGGSSGDGAEGPAKEPEAGSGADRDGEATSSADRDEVAVHFSGADAAQARKELGRLLAEGRAASKAKDFGIAVQRFRAALRINPAHSGVLGELGWAHFKAGELDEAEDALERALRHARDDAGRGMALYNLGRVHEARGDPEAAAAYYERSLARRPNDVVEARLTSLAEKLPTAVEAHPPVDCAFHRQAGAPPLELCAHVVASLVAQTEDAELASQILCEHNPTRGIDERDARPDHAVAAGEDPRITDYMLELDGGTKATIFSYREPEFGFTEVITLAVVMGGKWWTYPIAAAEHPGVSYADEEAHGFSIRAEQVLPGGDKELVVEWSLGGHDGDLEENLMWSYTTRQVALVSLEGGAPSWLATVRTRREEAIDTFLDDLPKSDDPSLGTESRQAAVVDWTSTPGKLSVQASSGDSPAPTGTFAVSQYPIRCPVELSWGGGSGSPMP